jgi:signal transduction histidine kinase
MLPGQPFTSVSKSSQAHNALYGWFFLNQNAPRMVSLNGTKLFIGLSSDEFHTIASLARYQNYQPGQTVFKEGDPGDGVYVVIEGKVEVAVGEGHQRVLTNLGEGEYFGEMAVLDGDPRSATVTAVDSSQLCFIPRVSLLAVLDQSPRLAMSLIRMFSLRMREFNRHYLDEVIQSEKLTVIGRFARSIVHDIKNPLAIIALAAEFGTEETANKEIRQTARTRIRKQVDRLSNMIDELLEFTKGSKTSVVLALTDYPTFIAQLIEEIQPEFAQKSVTISCESHPPAVRLLIDPHRLSRVFYNLAQNSADAMPGGGAIRLRFRREEREIITEFEDSGPGINPQIAARLFEPFATYGKPHGTGLGLSICQRIIDDHQGRIHAQNATGGGAVFWFSLPVPV